jgi:preprotein translocase subunit SecB
MDYTGRMWKEADVACFRIMFPYFREEIKEIHKTPQSV